MGQMQEPNEPFMPQGAEEALDEIDRILHQMLMLAGLSASDSNVDRENLQLVLERLKNKIDRIADQLDDM